MKTLSFFIFLATFWANAQDPPPQITKSFEAHFPGQKVLVWHNDSSYDYEGDMPEEVYNRDPGPDGYQDSTIKKNDHGYDPNNNEMPQNFEPPSKYTADFVMGGVDMTATFKADGTFVIATGKVDSLPDKVSAAIKKEFERQDYKLTGDMVEAIVPSSDTPIYRVFVAVKHQKKRTVKINGNGKVISNTEK